MVRGLRIAILGTRGIPASYGGFETFAEELSARLVERGNHVTVYGRRPFFRRYTGPSSHRGVDIRVTPTIMHKYFETPVHALTSMLSLLRQRYDVVLLCNAANSPFAFLIKVKGIPLLINVDGIERERKKWNAFGKLWYQFGELCSVLFANRIVADAQVIGEYYQKAYTVPSVVIPYGVHPNRRPAGETLARFGLRPKEYLLYVSRLEPENNALGVIQAFRRVESSFPLVIVGDAPYADEYKKKLREAADERVIFTGFQFGASYQELQSNCYLYIQATEVGGTHPALIESMSYGNCVIVNGTPENLEVIQDTGRSYPKNDFGALAATLQELLAVPFEVARLGAVAEQLTHSRYSWERVVALYEDLFSEVCGSK